MIHFQRSSALLTTPRKEETRGGWPSDHSFYVYKASVTPYAKSTGFTTTTLQLLRWEDKAVYQLRAAAQSGGCVGLDAGLQDSEGDDTRWGTAE